MTAMSKPKKKPRPNRAGVPLGLYIRPELFEALGHYVERARPRTSKTGVIEMLLEQFLTAQGDLQPKPAEGEKPPPEDSP